MNRSHTYIIILLALFFGFNGNAQDYTLTTQTEVDAFDQNISEINGFLVIDSEISSSEPITNLDSLSKVTLIAGNLEIKNNDSLNQINGLANLTSIGGSLEISNNDILSQINSLSNLTTIESDLNIVDNDSLRHLDGLSKISSINDVQIRRNDILSQIDGLSNLTTITGSLGIQSNNTLSQLIGLSKLTSIGGDLNISHNQNLSQLDGLMNLASIGGDFLFYSNNSIRELIGLFKLNSVGGNSKFYNNQALRQIDGLNNLVSIGANLSINNNTQLKYISGLSNLSSIGGSLSIFDHFRLNHVDGLINLTSVGNVLKLENNRVFRSVDGLIKLSTVGGLQITNNDSLIHINALSNLTSIRGEMIISGNELIRQIDGLSNLTSVANNIRISSNDELNNIDGFSSLASIGGILSITRNRILGHLAGLSNLSSIGGNLTIQENNELTEFDGLSNLTYIGEDLNIESNINLDQIDGLTNLTSIGGRLSIQGNRVLRHINGLLNLTTIPRALYIIGNDKLSQLDGLSNVTSIGRSLEITYNIELNQIDGLSNVQSIEGNLTIQTNYALTDCCGIQHLLNDPDAINGTINFISNSAACSSSEVVLGTKCGSSYIYNDINENCIRENELGINNRRAIIEPNNIIIKTNSAGRLDIDLLPIGNYKITIDTFGPWTTNCPASYDFEVTHPDTLPVIESFGLTATDPCPMASISLQMPFARPCFEQQRIHIETCNRTSATGAIRNGTVLLTLDTILTFQEAEIAFDSVQPFQFIFDVGDINPGDCVRFWVDVMVSCDAVLGQNLCLEAELTPIEHCIYQISSPVVNTFSNCSTPYDNSNLAVSGYCQDNVVKFELKNSGESMTCFAPIRIFSDGEFDSKDSIQLMADEIRIIEIPADGHTWRMEIDQHPEFIGLSQPNVTVERCGDINEWTAGLVGTRYLDDLDPHVDIFCTEVRGSYDPNDKTGYPEGVTEDHFVLPNQKMEYLIRFQNTGTDTAFTVVIRDTLDTDFDIFSVQSTVASHPYTFKLYGPRVLEWTFSNILLPDSTTNETGSHGFVTFEVHQNPNLDNQTKLTNTAAIFFDFNEPIITNETMHTVNDGIQQISSTANLQGLNNKLFELFPNPTAGNLYIDLKKTYQDIQVDLYSFLGQQVKREDFKSTDQLKITMDVSPGVYFIIVSVDEGYKEVLRVMKE